MVFHKKADKCEESVALKDEKDLNIPSVDWPGPFNIVDMIGRTAFLVA